MITIETDFVTISVPRCKDDVFSLLSKLANRRDQGVYLSLSRLLKKDALGQKPVTLSLILPNLFQQLLQQAERGKRFVIIGSISDLTITCWPVMMLVKQRFPHLAFYLLPTKNRNYISKSCLPAYRTMLKTTGNPISLCPEKFPQRLNKYYEMISSLCSTVLLYALRSKSLAAMKQFTNNDVEIIPCLEQINEQLNEWKNLQAAVRPAISTVRQQCNSPSPAPIDISAIENLFQLTERWNAKTKELEEVRNLLGIRLEKLGEWE